MGPFSTRILRGVGPFWTRISNDAPSDTVPGMCRCNEGFAQASQSQTDHFHTLSGVSTLQTGRYNGR